MGIQGIAGELKLASALARLPELAVPQPPTLQRLCLPVCTLTGTGKSLRAVLTAVLLLAG